MILHRHDVDLCQIIKKIRKTLKTLNATNCSTQWLDDYELQLVAVWEMPEWLEAILSIKPDYACES